jgi:Tfp pilus assembly protein PilN
MALIGICGQGSGQRRFLLVQWHETRCTSIAEMRRQSKKYLIKTLCLVTVVLAVMIGLAFWTVLSGSPEKSNTAVPTLLPIIIIGGAMLLLLKKRR